MVWTKICSNTSHHKILEHQGQRENLTFKNYDIQPRVLHPVTQWSVRGGKKRHSQTWKGKKRLLCTRYREASEGYVPFLKRANKKANRVLTQKGSGGDCQVKREVLSNIEICAPG